MTETTFVPAPGSRVHAAQHAAEQAAAPAAPQPPAGPPAGAMTAVPVRHTEPAPVYTAPARFASYSTVLVPASSGNVPGTARLLPRDDERVTAWILPIDGPIIIASTIEQAQDPANIGGTYPSGAFAPAGGYPVTHREPVYACNPSTSASVRVSVMVERGGAVGTSDE